MARWLTYIHERFPPITFAILATALCWSAAELFRVSPFSIPIQTSYAMVGTLLFFFVLRLMDEVKDYDKDRQAHPQRPLPRGLIRINEAIRGVEVGMILMSLFALVLFVADYQDSALLYASITFYLGLMYREFYAGKKLADRPFLYGFAHQMVLIPIVAFLVSIYHGKGWLMPHCWQLGITVLGAFFTYELCRKLDPAAHPSLKTYPQVYGRGGTLFRVSLTTAIALLGSSLLHIEAVSAPPLLVTWIASIVWVQRPNCFKITEGLATLSLLLHLGCIPLFHWMSRWIQAP